MKLLKMIFFAIAGIIAIFMVLVFFQFQGPGKNPHKERFVIGQHETEEETVDKLVQNGFLRNQQIFEVALFLVCWRKENCPVVSHWIEPGAYLVANNMNAYQVAKTLINGPYQKWLTIPPGKRKEQVALITKRALDWPEEKMFEFIEIAKEGYLCPETYLINPELTAQEVAQRMEDTFNQAFDQQVYSSLLEVNIRNDTAIKMASLIERESGGNLDKPIIAGIIFNRLEKGMRLEIDATVQYVLAGEYCQFSNQLLSGKTPINECHFWPQVKGGQPRKTLSPFNTYTNKGLPPAPICSPSLASIKAVANPAETEALFYLHSSDKKIHTAETYQEHLENIEKFLR